MPIAVDRNRWWVVIGYEVSMFRGLLGLRGLITVQSEDPQSSVWLLGNIIPESKVLHTRNLCDFCTSRRTDDIKPSDLFDNYDTDQKYETLRRLMKCLDQQYGTSDEGSARWAFNKKLAHPTKERGEGFDYTPFLDRVVPVLQDIIVEIETLRGSSE
jgi:hypothetical protein